MLKNETFLKWFSNTVQKCRTRRYCKLATVTFFLSPSISILQAIFWHWHRHHGVLWVQSSYVLCIRKKKMIECPRLQNRLIRKPFENWTIPNCWTTEVCTEWLKKFLKDLASEASYVYFWIFTPKKPTTVDYLFNARALKGFRGR